MTYPESLPKIRGNKRKFHPGIKAKGELNHRPMNLSGLQFHLHAGLKGKQKYLTDLAMCTVMNVPLKFFGTMTDNLSFQTRSSEFVTEFRGESPNIEMSEHRQSPTIN
jgi:ubiquitin-protein ligase